MRPVQPNEYNQLDGGSMLASEGGPTMILGDFLGVDPGAYGSSLQNRTQSYPARYNPNTKGVSRTWSGGPDLSLPEVNYGNSGSSQPRSANTQTRSDVHPLSQPPISWEDLFRDTLINKTDNPLQDNRTHQEMDKDVWHPIDMSRYAVKGDFPKLHRSDSPDSSQWLSEMSDLYNVGKSRMRHVGAIASLFHWCCAYAQKMTTISYNRFNSFIISECATVVPL